MDTSITSSESIQENEGLRPESKFTCYSFPITSSNSIPLKDWELRAGDGLALECSTCQKVRSSSTHWRKLFRRFQKLWHMLSAFHRLTAEGLSGHVHSKSRSSTNTNLRPAMFFFLSWLVISNYCKQAWNQPMNTWSWMAHPKSDPGHLQHLKLQWSPQPTFHYCARKCSASAC